MNQFIRSFALIALFFTFCTEGSAQIAVNTDGTNPDAKAMLDVKSTDKGLLIPRMTTAQRTGITGLTVSQKGLLVYDTDLNSVWQYNGTVWAEVGSVPTSVWTTLNPTTIYTTKQQVGINNINPLAALHVNGQVAVNTDGTAPDAKAVLDMKSTDKGLLIPRMTTAQRTGMVIPIPEGLLVYDITTHSVWQYNATTLAWVEIGSEVQNLHVLGRLTVGNSTASGVNSTALGTSTASNTNALASGSSTASGVYATALGNNTTASGSYSMASGSNSTASGSYSIAMGGNSTASGFYSTAMGTGTIASGEGSTALGYASAALGRYTTALGYFTNAKAYASTTIGHYNDPIASSSTSTWVTTDPLFIAGNGTSDAARSNALVLYKNGDLNITGRLASGSSTASGVFSTALGNYSTASAYYSTALGFNSTASGISSTASGYNSTASGHYSTALGNNSMASGYGSMASGNNVSARSAYCTVFGILNNAITATAQINDYDWISTDPLFIIGNGNPSMVFDPPTNAITILKNGNMGFGSIIAPTFRIEIPNIANSTGQGKANAWITYSDNRVKFNQKPLQYGLSHIMQMKVKSYDHYSSEFKNGALVLSNSKPTFGLIAQELYQIIPEMVNKPTDESKDLWSIDYDKFGPLLVKTVQEQQAQIEALKKENEAMQQQITALQQQNAAFNSLKADMETLKAALQSSLGKQATPFPKESGFRSSTVKTVETAASERK